MSDIEISFEERKEPVEENIKPTKKTPKKKEKKKDTDKLSIDLLVNAINKTIESGSTFVVGFSKKYDECITNHHGVTMKELRVIKSRHTNSYYTELTCYSSSPYHNFHDEDDDEMANEEDYSEILSRRTPFLKGRINMSDNNIHSLLKTVFDIFNDKIKICNICTEVHRDTTETCNNCLVLSVFKQIVPIHCVICLEEAKIYCTLPCKHSFHNKCVMGLKHWSCPLCRAAFELPLSRGN